MKGVGGSRVKDGGAPPMHLGAARTLANDVHSRGHLLRTGPGPTVGAVNHGRGARTPRSAGTASVTAARCRSFELLGWSHEERNAFIGIWVFFFIFTMANTTVGQ